MQESKTTSLLHSATRAISTINAIVTTDVTVIPRVLVMTNATDILVSVTKNATVTHATVILKHTSCASAILRNITFGTRVMMQNI
jgi:hypothetical protein